VRTWILLWDASVSRRAAEMHGAASAAARRAARKLPQGARSELQASEVKTDRLRA